MSVTSAFWEAKAGGSTEARSLRQPALHDENPSLLKIQKLARHDGTSLWSHVLRRLVEGSPEPRRRRFTQSRSHHYTTTWVTERDLIWKEKIFRKIKQCSSTKMWTKHLNSVFRHKNYIIIMFWYKFNFFLEKPIRNIKYLRVLALKSGT